METAICSRCRDGAFDLSPDRERKIRMRNISDLSWMSWRVRAAIPLKPQHGCAKDFFDSLLAAINA
jgi:hypothetical protein